jgi:formylmethanofuran dehydrogenase subunit E
MSDANYLSDLDGLLAECASLHGHICPGQLLGVRMAILGCRLVGISDPRGSERKNLIVWVEIDRCVADALSAVTGVRLGKRSLKYLDYGKVAATFMNIAESLSVRIVAKDESRALADELHPDLVSKKGRQMLTYREASAEELFKIEPVQICLHELDVPGKPRKRITCELCREGINDGREILDALNRRICRACAFGAYYQTSRGASDNT